MKYFFYTILTIALFPFIVHAEITRTLKLGDRGIDVRELQVFLNKDPDTQIATNGIGSPGAESTYFGTRTMLAVKKFQTKYAYQTLTPAGLSIPTGIVGYYTRLQLYKLSRPTSGFISVGTSPAQSAVTIGSITPTTVTRFPQTITINGTGFTEINNTINISSELESGITGVASPDGKTLSFSFAYSGVAKARSQLARYQNTANYNAIKAAYLANITETSATAIPVTVSVKNSLGQSVPVTIYVNLATML